MATSTEQINDLIGGYTDLKGYFEGIRGQIDADLDAATLRVGDTRRAFSVDQDLGDDANDGTGAYPLKTLQAAVNRSVYGGELIINLKSNYVLDKALVCRSGLVKIQSSIPGVPRAFTCADQVSDVETTGPRLTSHSGNTFFHFKDINITMSTGAPHIVANYMIGATGLTQVLMIDCLLNVPAGSDQYLIQRVNGHGFGITVQSTVYPTGMAGRWVIGIAGGTTPDAVNNLSNTNLSSF